MSHFYGTMQGSRGEATRCGTKSSGIEVVAAGWGGAIRTSLFVDDQGRDCYLVEQIAWQGVGEYKKLAEGVVGGGRKAPFYLPGTASAELYLIYYINFDP